MTTNQIEIKSAAVLGAGTMGSQIAALLANRGIRTLLLDLPSTDGDRSKMAKGAKERLSTMRPPAVDCAASLERITPGNFDDDIAKLADADWVIEAVSENLDIKKAIWSKAAKHIKPTAIASTNTSGIRIAIIAEALPKDMRSRFLGAHFFNPPRYLKLLEVIPTAETSPQVFAGLSAFAENTLGKGVVKAKDVPNFIGNRVGIFSLMAALHAMDDLSFGADDVDAVTGPASARPSSATFRTIDLIGIDVMIDVCENVLKITGDPWEQKVFAVPQYMREMLKKGMAGEKKGQGFFKRSTDGGKSSILTLDHKTLEYRPGRKLEAESLNAVRRIDNPGERLKKLVSYNDPAGQLAWKALSGVMAYSAKMVGVVADDIVSIDRAMKWGFAWELGPFEAWDALGVAEATKRMKADGLPIPTWVEKIAATGGTLYQHQGGATQQLGTAGKYKPVSQSSREISYDGLKRAGRSVIENPGATLFDIGDGVAFLDFHSAKQAIGMEMLEMIEKAAQKVENDFQGLVISSHVRPNFSVGFNLKLVLDTANAGEWNEIDTMIRRFQYGLLAVKRLKATVVTAPFGLALGGGAEISLHGHRMVAGTELSMGLVETLAGIVPAGGGCKEMLIRALEKVPGGLGGSAADANTDKAAYDAVEKVFATINMGKTSGSATEARSLGFLRPTDSESANADHLLFLAKQAVLEIRSKRPALSPKPVQLQIRVLGAGAAEKLLAPVKQAQEQGKASEHDVKVAGKLARVLTGGDRPAGGYMSEEDVLELERGALMALCPEPKTLERIDYVLKNGKPLKN
ncbi:MAG: 3-hydroxyacyl-CoA dehydrogenase/enoyl-CoA hydratase family protein [SAR202 cluster bacterium]|nr:3-hydroxyacyl-CoA dehydrogenase/enoyl-CoA hydratase family protein [SAR202 cluster bacterium]